jgi:hypothetical protein
MKKSISLAALIAVSSLFIVGCSKDDTEAPIISLIGSNPFQLEMLQTYSEPGATAEDNEDGDISSSINVDDSDIDNLLPGTYYVNYTVSDAAGNQGTNSREIVVYATNNAMDDSYSVIDICGTGAAADTFLYQQNITATGASTITFNKFADYSNNTGITATVAGNGAITLPFQPALNIGTATEDHDFSGTGSVTESGFILNYTDKNNSSIPVATSTCQATYTRN